MSRAVVESGSTASQNGSTLVPGYMSTRPVTSSGLAAAEAAAAAAAGVAEAASSGVAGVAGVAGSGLWPLASPVERRGEGVVVVRGCLFGAMLKSCSGRAGDSFI